MKRLHIIVILFSSLAIMGCNDYNKVLKSTDYSYRYEAAKQLFNEGHYNRAAVLLEGVIAMTKGTDQGEESLFLLGMSSYKSKNYVAASSYFKKYYQTYPKGIYTEEAYYYNGKSLYNSTPEPRLDQSATYEAVTEFNTFLENYPYSRYRDDAQKCIFNLQDKLVEKEYIAAKLYYDLGTYFGNCTNGGSNYQACIVTAENAIKDYPYSSRREDLAILILSAKFDLAEQSVAEKQEERYNNAIDEFYGFQNEFPESKFMPKAQSMYEKAKKHTMAGSSEAAN